MLKHGRSSGTFQLWTFYCDGMLINPCWLCFTEVPFQQSNIIIHLVILSDGETKG